MKEGVCMIVYKFKPLDALKEKGYSAYRLRKEKLIGEAMIQKIRKEELPSWDALDIICELLNCQPGDIIEHRS